MDPIKAAAAAAFCLVLFWLAFRLTRRLVDLAIAAGHAEERRRAFEAAAGDASHPKPGEAPHPVPGVPAAGTPAA